MKQMVIKRDNIFIYLFFIACLAIFSSLAGFRPIDDFSIDTESYISFFLSISRQDEIDMANELMEPGFVLLTFIISRFTDNFHIYLSLLFFLFNSILFIFWKYLASYLKIQNYSIFLLLLFGFTLSSNWYNNFCYNGLRQGIAAPLIYISILKVIDKKYIKSLFFFIIALLFHKSALLVLIFYPILFLRIRYVLIIYFFLGGLYVTNLSEQIIKKLSDQINPLIYLSIADYGGDDAMYVGFSFSFFLYSFFLVLIIYFTYFLKDFLFNRAKIVHFYKLFKIYVVLIAPYFLFGFGGFSNRYAVYGWFFMPLFFTIFIWDIKLYGGIKSAFLFFLLLFALYKNLIFYFYV